MSAPPPPSSSSSFSSSCSSSSSCTPTPTTLATPSSSSSSSSSSCTPDRSFPILTPACRFHGGLPRSGGAARPHDGHVSGASRTTGTLFGYRKARITFAIQETPGSVPILLLELAMQTGKFMQEVGAEHLRVALESEKKAAGCGGIGKTRLLDEPLWTTYMNGRKIRYAVWREPTEDDLTVMQLLHTVSVGAGVLPSDVFGPGLSTSLWRPTDAWSSARPCKTRLLDEL